MGNLLAKIMSNDRLEGMRSRLKYLVVLVTKFRYLLLLFALIPFSFLTGVVFHKTTTRYFGTFVDYIYDVDDPEPAEPHIKILRINFEVQQGLDLDIAFLGGAIA